MRTKRIVLVIQDIINGFAAQSHRTCADDGILSFLYLRQFQFRQLAFRGHLQLDPQFVNECVTTLKQSGVNYAHTVAASIDEAQVEYPGLTKKEVLTETPRLFNTIADRLAERFADECVEGTRVRPQYRFYRDRALLAVLSDEQRSLSGQIGPILKRPSLFEEDIRKIVPTMHDYLSLHNISHVLHDEAQVLKKEHQQAMFDNAGITDPSPIIMFNAEHFIPSFKQNPITDKLTRSMIRRFDKECQLGKRVKETSTDQALVEPSDIQSFLNQMRFLTKNSGAGWNR